MSVGILQPEQLAERVAGHEPDTIVVDARRHKAFLAGHIPGAVWMGWESWCEAAPSHAGPTLAQDGYWGVLAPVDVEECGSRLTSLGIQADRPILVYADGLRTRGREGRIAWMLLYFGASTVKLLDGGWSGWVGAGGATEVEMSHPVAGEFEVRLHPERRATLDSLRDAVHDGTAPVCIDTRSAAEFVGEIQAYLPRRGHLPGAHLVPFATLFDADGRYVRRDRYLAALPPAARDARKLVAYCEVGVRASLFAILHEVHTGQVVPVYDGSLMQWALQPDLPVQMST